MKYSVLFESFTERHYVKTFEKKYKGAWNKTKKALEIEFSFFDILFSKSIAETITVSSDHTVKICKTEFKILGTDISRHGSGNRCIVAVHVDTQTVYVLLVYTKTAVKGNNETNWWKGVIKNNYPEYSNLF